MASDSSCLPTVDRIDTAPQERRSNWNDASIGETILCQDFSSFEMVEVLHGSDSSRPY